MDASGSSHANGEDHVKDMNKFMAHIGVCYFFVRYKFRIVIYLNILLFYKKKVPFLMIPPPKNQEIQSPTMSPTTRRRMLRPLIISAIPNIF